MGPRGEKARDRVADQEYAHTEKSEPSESIRNGSARPRLIHRHGREASAAGCGIPVDDILV
jgi:hypothetical protein